MRITEEQLLIMKLEGKLPQGNRYRWLYDMTDSDCFKKLCELTGQDFGNDVAAWSTWVRAQTPPWENVDAKPISEEDRMRQAMTDRDAIAKVLDAADDPHEKIARLRAHLTKRGSADPSN